MISVRSEWSCASVPASSLPISFEYPLDTRGHVHPVAHQIVASNHNIADVDANAQRQLPREIRFLYCPGTVHRLDSTRELDEEAVADRLEEPTGVLRDLGLDDADPERLARAGAYGSFLRGSPVWTRLRKR